MESNNGTFLSKVLNIVQDELEQPLIEFEHPKDLEKILDLAVSTGVDDATLEHCIRQVLRYSVKTSKPTFRNQLYGATDPYGLAGAWIAEACNTSQYTFEVAPAFTLIENEILRHALRLFGIPSGDGIFSPGGSISLFYGMVAARFKRFPEVKAKGVKALPDLVVFTSEDSHYSIKKAAHWLGFGTESVKTIKATASGQMDVKALSLAIENEVSCGKVPLLVNATAGTTVLGAIDDLESIAGVCEKYGVWMHVDACWGGSLILSSKHKRKLKGISRAQSISWNAHKMLGAPLQCSIFLISEKGVLHEANSASAHYLFQQDKFYDVSYDTGDKSVQCGRKIDAFKLWVMWKARGDSGLADLVDKTMNLALFGHSLVSTKPGFEPVNMEMQCPNVCFWYIPTFMRNKERDFEWWDRMHKLTPKIKELLTLNSRLMVAYSPLRDYKNFFRLALTCHPDMEESHIVDMLKAIEECGESVTVDMIS